MADPAGPASPPLVEMSPGAPVPARDKLRTRRVRPALAALALLLLPGAAAGQAPGGSATDPSRVSVGTPAPGLTDLKAGFEKALEQCLKPVGPGRARDRAADCKQAREKALTYRTEATRQLRQGVRATPADLPELTAGLAAAEETAAKAEREAKANEDAQCALALSNRWCMDVPAFVGLLRVTFTSPNRFDSLSGFGTGVKFRYHALLRDGKRREVFGLVPFLYYEPKVPNSSGGEAGTFQRLSAGVMLTAAEHFTVGLGMTVAHDESGVKLKAADRMMLLVGLNVDASTLGRVGK